MTGLNFKKAGEESGQFESLPEERYELKVTNAELKTASTGTEMIATTFEVVSGKYKNRKLWNNFTLTPKSLVFLHQFLKKAGSKIIDQEDASAEAVIAEMVGMRVSAMATPAKTNQGNPTNTLSNWQASKLPAETGENKASLFD